MRGFYYAGSAWEYYERPLGLRECRDACCVMCGEDARAYHIHTENGLFGPDAWVTRDERPIGHLGLSRDTQHNMLCVRCGRMVRDVPSGSAETPFPPESPRATALRRVFEDQPGRNGRGE